MVRDDGGYASQTVDVINYIMPFLKSSSENLQYTIKYIDSSVPLTKQLEGNVFYEHIPCQNFNITMKSIYTPTGSKDAPKYLITMKKLEYNTF